MRFRIFWLRLTHTNPILACCLVVFALAACGPEPTPLPVVSPIPPTATPPPAALPPLRYALPGTIIEQVPDLPLIGASADLIALENPVVPDDLGQGYDIIATYGLLPGWTPADLTPVVSLVFNPARPPLKDPALAAIIRASIDPRAWLDTLAIPGAEIRYTTEDDTANGEDPLALRTQLANLGYPDGVTLALGAMALPGVTQLTAQISAAGIKTQTQPMTANEIRDALASGRIQAALVVWTLDAERESWVARYGADQVQDLYTTPIAYRAIPDLTISYTPGGWPLVSR